MNFFSRLIFILITFFSINLLVGQETYRDNFSSISYSNNNGSQNFSSNWIERNDNNSPNGEKISINSNQLTFNNLDGANIYRFVPLAGASGVTLTLDYNATARGGESLAVSIYNTTTQTFNQVFNINTNTTGSLSYNLTAAEVASNPAIYISTSSGNWGNGDQIRIDNVLFTAYNGPTISINDVTVDEDDGSATFTATSNGASLGSSFTVNYQTVNGSATAGGDYTSISGTMTFNGNVGDTETFTVPILDDTNLENTETFIIQMTSASSLSVNISDTGTGSILDNESITMNDGSTTTECDKIFLDPGGLGNYGNNLDVTHTICPEAGFDYVSVDFTSFDLDAGGDFLYVYDGNSTGATLIGQYDNDNLPSTLSASPGTSGCLTFRFTSNNNANGTGFQADIKCNIEGPRLVIDDVSIDEDGGNILFTVTSTRAAHGRNVFLFGFINTPFTVDYTTVNNTALSGSDYTATSGTLTFTGAIGYQRTISVPITDDGIPEFDEDFFIEFTGSNAPDVAVNIDDTGKGTINSQILANVPLTLFRQFDGDYDYATTGGSLRTQSNDSNSCAIQTSSSNQLVSNIPDTGTIKAAYLYWAHSSYVRDEQVTFEGQTINAGFVYQTTFAASQSINLSFYGYVSDVTSLVSAIPDINNNNFDFSGLTIDTSNNYCSTATVLGGWSLMVYYEDPSLPAVSINLYQGFDGLQNNSPGTQFTLDSFFAIDGLGAKATFLSWEGDDTLGSSGANPEALTITNESNQTFTLADDGGQTGNNAYNGTIFDDTTAPIYNQLDTYGVDLDTYDISNYISPGDSQVTATVNVGQDYVINMAVVMKVPSNLITGTVFEDINYPGGEGRNQIISGGTVLSGVTVELFEDKGQGQFIERKITDNNGQYSFAGMEDGDYLIKVVNPTVRSNRDNGLNCTECIAVQTHRTFGDANTVTEINNEIGGAYPSALQDAALGIARDAQTISLVTVASNGVTNINFGFNFNTIVNSNENGRGSLNQFIINSNNLGETGLDIESNSIFDPLAGEDTSIFMIPPTGDAFGRVADANYTGGIFDLLISDGNPLSVITGTNTIIDGRTQTAYSGDSNSGSVGSGGSAVGTSAVALPNFDKPEIQVHSNNGDVFQTTGNGVTIRNLSVYANNNSAIKIIGGTGTVSNSLIGVNASGINAGNLSYGVEVTGGIASINENYIATNIDAGILVNGGTSTTIENNHITNNGNSPCDDNITLTNGTGIIINHNLIDSAASLAIDDDGVSGNVVVSENTIINSGQNGGACSGNIENMGVRLLGSNSSIINNVIASNRGSGIVLTGGNTTGNLISKNSIYANGTASNALGIDLDSSSIIGDGVTLNESNDSDNGPNGLLNFPILSGSYVSGSNLVVNGWVRPGSVIEIFLTDVDRGTANMGDNQLGLSTDYGEGQTYLATFIEGSAEDLSSKISSYLDVDGNIDNTNKFQFKIPLPSGVVVGTFVTTTATISNSTSEFSPFSIVENYTLITNRKITYRVKEN
ncbi:right-handed parallel beta-helix repeat-containing protein [Cellulophaga sp. HaHaR_3_176]|uniref:beta strand repeat-containing protein n=1 Tax=Cellulophaga sp. HaHaR_3_176 TaxID=1942464 RepID=UPI001C1FD0CA|nr:Calx-beta domain-containing protein [Cellulophaga sp. HaHaR_3_176]QWX84434.1 right-handed parallel beta-helix repeat-containing protein [Cellulophaga sp. HaHaR_3_176]